MKHYSTPLISYFIITKNIVNIITFLLEFIQKLSIKNRWEIKPLIYKFYLKLVQALANFRLEQRATKRKALIC